MAQASISSSSFVVNIGYDGSDGASADFLMPPLQSKVGQPIVAKVGSVYTGGNDWSSNPAYRISNSDFAFEFVQDSGGSGGSLQLTISAQVTIAANNAWKAAAEARAALMANWVALLEKIDALEAAGVLVRNGTRIIAETIGTYIPAPPVETLFYRLGLQPGIAGGQIAYCDLLPGMQLRVEFEQSQFIAPGSNMNGYIGGAQVRWQIAARASADGYVSGFDPFLNTVASPSIQAATPAVAGGLLDLQRAGASRRYLRLCLPQNVASGNGAGDLSLSGNVALIGADTLTELNAATAAYVQGNAAAAPATCTILRGRSIAIPEIPIWLTDANKTNHLEWVPVGTTVANVLDRYLQWRPLSPIAAMPVWLYRNVVVRSGQSAMNETLSVFPLAFFPQGSNVPIDPASYDIPLMPGDRFGLVGASRPA